ncbi:MAG: hypothetical protein ACOCQX_05000 [Candidatus Nanoarchaeia archaeon]
MSDLVIYLAFCIAGVGVIYLITGGFNIIAELIGMMFGKPVLFVMKYSNLEPSLRVPKKGNQKRSEMQCCATLMFIALILLGLFLVAMTITGSKPDGLTVAFLILIAFILLPYFRIQRISQKIEDKDVDENYFIFKSPLALLRKIIK